MSAKLYVNSNNIKRNIEYIKNKLSDKTKIIAMVKANAYGCGAVKIAKYLESIGISDFGVALVSEGVLLRNSRNKFQNNCNVWSFKTRF